MTLEIPFFPIDAMENPRRWCGEPRRENALKNSGGIPRAVGDEGRGSREGERERGMRV